MTRLFGVDVNVFYKYRTGTNESKRNATIFHCKAWHDLRQRIGFKIAKTISKRAMGFIRVEDVMNWCDLTPFDFQTLINFTRSNNTHLVSSGLDFKKTVWFHIQYYNSINYSQAINNFFGEKGLVPSSDQFISELISLYNSNKGDIHNSISVLLLHSLVTKINGRKNAKNNTKVVNFLFILQLVAIGRPMVLLLSMLMVWLFTNPNDTFPKVIPSHSYFSQGAFFFKLSSQISLKYVATLIKINGDFIFTWSRCYYSYQIFTVLQASWRNCWWHQT